MKALERASSTSSGCFAAALNQPDQAVQDRQRGLRRLAFGRLQGFEDFCGFFGIGHAARLTPQPRLLASITSSTFGGDIGRL